MRHIMARITTVAQAARLCNVPAESLIKDLNHVLGIETNREDTGPNDRTDALAEQSSAAHSFVAVVELDVREELSNGGEPFSKIMAAVAALREGEALHLHTPFEPVPLFGVMEKRGFSHECQRHAVDDWSVWFYRGTPAAEHVQAIDAAVPKHSIDRTSVQGDADVNIGAARTAVWLDVRDLEPPEPLVRTLEALEGLAKNSVLVQVNVRVPQLLLPILRERGFRFTVDESQLNEVQVRIWRNE